MAVASRATASTGTPMAAAAAVGARPADIHDEWAPSNDGNDVLAAVANGGIAPVMANSR